MERILRKYESDEREPPAPLTPVLLRVIVILKRAELAACGEGRRVAGPQRSTKCSSAGADPVHAAPAA